MIRTFSLPLCADSLKAYGDWTDLQQELDTLGCDGIEAIWGGEPLPSKIPAGLVQGYHLLFFSDWVDLWRDNQAVLKEKFGSLEQAAEVYGGLGQETLFRQYWEDLERAEALGARYVVFHVSNVSLEECFTYRFRYSNAEVIEAALELINSLLTKRDWPFEFLVENQWWPGFTFTNPEETACLLDGIAFRRKGIVLDIGHLMNACPNIETQVDGAAYVSQMLEQHGSLVSSIRAVHMHQSVSSAYVHAHTGALPKNWPADQLQRLALCYAHVLQIDQHKPWTDPAIVPVLERIAPAYLTHELTSCTRTQRAAGVAWQQDLLGKREF